MDRDLVCRLAEELSVAKATFVAAIGERQRAALALQDTEIAVNQAQKVFQTARRALVAAAGGEGPEE